ncbi:hypothetical protein B0G81_3862 [Paraburkholderia sp. BL6665CI2N2]|nr:hypothetical protein B0G81_3862 [Paraburkholderia sp. BL6665CI2N2]
MNMIFKRRSPAGSLIGSTAETQEMLDFCGKRDVVSDIEMIRTDEINHAYERMSTSDVKYRFVADIATIARWYSKSEVLEEHCSQRGPPFMSGRSC